MPSPGYLFVGVSESLMRLEEVDDNFCLHEGVAVGAVLSIADALLWAAQFRVEWGKRALDRPRTEEVTNDGALASS